MFKLLYCLCWVSLISRVCGFPQWKVNITNSVLMPVYNPVGQVIGVGLVDEKNVKNNYYVVPGGPIQNELDEDEVDLNAVEIIKPTRNVQNVHAPKNNRYYQDTHKVPSRFSSNVPKCAQGQSYCEESSNPIPQHVLDRAMSQLDPSIFIPIKQENYLAPRLGDDFEPSCASRSVIAMAEAYDYKSNTWAFLLKNDTHEQRVESWKCTHNESDDVKNEPCKLQDGLSMHYATKCEQKYAKHNLYAIDQQDYKLIRGVFELPSWCACMYRKNWST